MIHPQVEPYQRLVGKLNLAAALVPSGHYNEAIDLLSELESTLDPQKQLVLLSNTFEVRTQAELFRGDYAKAKIYLDRARSTHSFGQQIMGLIFKKWQIILDWKIKGNSSSIEDAIIKLQDHARENSFYELVRDCDYYRSQMTENADLYDRLILGTAHPNYGLRFRNTVFEDRKASASYLWMGDGSTSAPEQVIDMANAKSIDGSLILKPKQIHYQLIRLLSTDFYRPFKLGEVFESLFEDQYFDPHSSPQRVYMAVSRLRSFLKKAGYAANLTDASEGYLFRPTSGFGVLVHKEMKDEDPRMVYIRRLQGEFGFDDFNSAQAGGVLDLSARQSITILNWAIANDLILQSGRGKATHYSIKGRTTKAA